jgi:hypothetical protein
MNKFSRGGASAVFHRIKTSVWRPSSASSAPGGIGLQLAEQIRVLEWQKVLFLILKIWSRLPRSIGFQASYASLSSAAAR